MACRPPRGANRLLASALADRLAVLDGVVRWTVDTGTRPGAAREAPEMPAPRSRWPRVQLNTRVRVEVEQLLHRFVDDHDTTVQNSVDLALVEFLAARGY